MKKTMSIVVMIAIIVVAVAGCASVEKPAGPVERITIATGAWQDSSLIYIALEKDYFKAEGLDIMLQSTYTSGKACLNAVIEGQADLGTVAETPLMHAGFRGEKTYTIATIQSSGKAVAVIARKDKGISTPSDLKGKRIGLIMGTNVEFFARVLLTFHEVSREEVEVVNLNPNEVFNALVQGEVDAVSIWQPVVVQLQNELGDNAITFYPEEIYTSTFNIAATQEFVNKNPETIEKFLRALIKADEFIEENPDEAQEIVAGKIGMDKATLNELWKLYNFRVTLDQSLIVTLEAEARWAIKNKLTDKTEVPNYLDYIYMDALEKVKPEAVGIIR